MAELQAYLDAATRPNTRRSYAAAVRHFEVEWGGCLPATPDIVARYLAHFGPTLAANTLAQRLAALARWHADHGFVDPTRAPIVKQAMRGIRTLHPRAERRATPLQLTQLGQLADGLEAASVHARARGDKAEELRHLRDRAMILLGFWRGFRADELISLQAEHVTFIDNGLECFLGRSKADRAATGKTHRLPALTRWCAVAALRAWLDASGLKQGPVFRRISAQGKVGTRALHANSVIPLLRSALMQAGLAAGDYSSHSLRRGFASWANANGWDLKSLMEYVGWRDIHSAMRYIDVGRAFAAMPVSPDAPTAPRLLVADQRP